MSVGEKESRGGRELREKLLADPDWHKSLAQLLAHTTAKLGDNLSGVKTVAAEVPRTAAAVAGAIARAAEDPDAVRSAGEMRINYEGSLVVLLTALLDLRTAAGNRNWVRWRPYPVVFSANIRCLGLCNRLARSKPRV